MKESTINETMSPAAHQAAKPRRRKVKESRGDRIYYAIVYAVDWDSGLIIRENAVTIGPEETTLEFTTTTALIGESDFEMLFQFGSAALAELGEVVIEISEITVLQSVLI